MWMTFFFTHFIDSIRSQSLQAFMQSSAASDPGQSVLGQMARKNEECSEKKMEEVVEAQHGSLDATDALASVWSDALAEGVFEAASS